MNASQAAHGEAFPLELRLWSRGEPVRHAVRTLVEAFDVLGRSGADRAFLAKGADDGPPWPSHPPVAGLVVTRAAGEACLAMSLPATGRGKRPGGISFSRRIVDVLLMHPQGIRRSDLVEKVTSLAGRPVPHGTVNHTLWRYGRRDPRDPNVWTASPSTAAKTTGRIDRVEDPAGRSKAPRGPVAPRAPFFDWDDGAVATLRRLAADGADADQVMEALGAGVTRNAVASKAHRLGVALGRPGRKPTRR